MFDNIFFIEHMFYICVRFTNKSNKLIMKVSKIILEKLRNDLNFRLNTALALEVGERNVQYLVDRESKNLLKKPAIDYYLSTGLTLEEIQEESIEDKNITA